VTSLKKNLKFNLIFSKHQRTHYGDVMMNFKRLKVHQSVSMKKNICEEIEMMLKNDPLPSYVLCGMCKAHDALLYEKY
jgi:hypothetical protein